MARRILCITAYSGLRIVNFFFSPATKMYLHWIIEVMLLSNFWNVSHAMIVWSTNTASHEGKMKIKHNLVKIASEQSNKTEFEDHQRKLANRTLDERCKSGQELSVAFQLYRPYVNTQQHGKLLLALTL